MHSVSGWWGGKRRFIVQLAPFIRRSVNPEKGSGYNRTTGLTTPTIRVDRGPPGIAGIERDLQLNKPLLSNPRRSRRAESGPSWLPSPRYAKRADERKRVNAAEIRRSIPSSLPSFSLPAGFIGRRHAIYACDHDYCELLDKRGNGTENLAARLSYSCDVPFSTPCSSG